MADCKQILFLFYLVLITSAKAEDLKDPKRSEIEALEKEKSKLYKQINDAIDDSVKILTENNDTDSKIGISLIKDLKKQLEVLNGTELLNDFKIRNDTRRSGKKENKFHIEEEVYRKNKKSDKLFLDDLLDKAQNSKKFKERLEHRIQMQSRIQDWLQKKQEEKTKIKKYLYNGTLAGAKREKCYRYGVNKKKKGKKYKGWFPCCRKCCKKSYMGCL